MAGAIRHDFSLLSKDDLYLFNEGSHFDLADKMGATLTTHDGQEGVYFAVWAPNAHFVSVQGDFNDWDTTTHPLMSLGESGIWHGFIPDVKSGQLYKYFIRSKWNDYEVSKADPYAFLAEEPPRTASRIWDLTYEWHDQDWRQRRSQEDPYRAPMAIYEMHLGSWMRREDGSFQTYREVASKLVEYLLEMGFTHVEFLPLSEHPFYGSWGYQTTGYFAPTSRYGTPQDFMFLVDSLHQAGIGVILDWVPSHFPSDEHGLGYFDGTHLYEHADPRKGFHPDWDSLIFNYGRNEVRSFLISSAMFWLEKYHIDALRVDAVASMLYLDYSRKDGEWIPNEQGGRENLEAIAFLKRLNEALSSRFANVPVIAEESTAWPLVSHPTHLGGLGFSFKWDMGWMHDTLFYMEQDPLFRKYHHNQLTFRMMYAFSEHFVLALSHDEVVHGKRSLLEKMPGDFWQKRANLRLLFGYMYAQPGKKLVFMGAEFGQKKEWSHEASLSWELLEKEEHQGLRRWMKDLNHFYRRSPSLYEDDYEEEGFEWINCQDHERSILSFLRRSRDDSSLLLVVCNFVPVVYSKYKVGVPYRGYWREELNSDAEIYGGSGQGNLGGLKTSDESTHGRPYTLEMTLPPLSILFFSYDLTSLPSSVS